MKTIICPTDFSPAATNALEYAANLAKSMHAELKIMHVQLLVPIDVVEPGESLIENKSNSLTLLKKMCNEVNVKYKISCSYELDTTNKTFEKIIVENSKGSSLVVMGTNGVDDVYQYFFGTNAFHVVEHASCPVLIVPEGVVYDSITKVVFAWDYNSKSKFNLMQLNLIIDLFDPQLTILHVSAKKSQATHDIFKAFKDEVITNLNKKNDITFEQLFSDDAEDSLNEYMLESDANLLVITFYDRGMIRNAFHGEVAKKLSEDASYPMLVLPI